MEHKIAVIVTAAGSSTRMGGGIKKEYLPLKNGTVLSESVKPFLHSSGCSILVVTHPAGGLEESQNAIKKDLILASDIKNLTEKNCLKLIFQEGGSSRQESVFNGIEAVMTAVEESGENPDDWIVLIHDGARPFVSSKVILNTVEGVRNFQAAVPGVKPVDTQKLLDENGFVVQHLNRSLMTAVQTPQGFILGKLFEAHKKASKDSKSYTDDTEIWGNYVGPVKVVEGDVENIKVTYAKDYKMVEIKENS